VENHLVAVEAGTDVPIVKRLGIDAEARFLFALKFATVAVEGRRPMDLCTLTDTVVRHWPFNAEHYPILRHLPAEEHAHFSLGHILDHQIKACGKLAEVVEPLAHGAPIDDFRLHLATRNFLANTLRLAAVAGITPDELAAEMSVWAREVRTT